mmetsp:Transcript_7576/g.21158  ORF Transcript_7576/g.21158 Transcript_7576/m.21158 type:complete len:222 (-) Transcript_7576:3597-4262(-)
MRELEDGSIARLGAGGTRGDTWAAFLVVLGGHAVGDMDLDLVVVRRQVHTRRWVILVAVTFAALIPRINTVGTTIWLALHELELELHDVALVQDRVLVAGTGLAVNVNSVVRFRVIRERFGGREQEVLDFRSGLYCIETERRNDFELNQGRRRAIVGEIPAKVSIYRQLVYVGVVHGRAGSLCAPGYVGDLRAAAAEHNIFSTLGATGIGHEECSDHVVAR